MGNKGKETIGLCERRRVPVNYPSLMDFNRNKKYINRKDIL